MKARERVSKKTTSGKRPGSMATKRMSARILGQCEHPRGQAALRRLSRQSRSFLAALGLSGVELSLVVTTDSRIRDINRRWRDKDQATDVLSFPAGEMPAVAGAPRPLGDVIISLDTAVRRAREDGRPVAAETARYLAHGLLHLLGHDHHRPAEAARMARAERRLLGALGMVGEALGTGRR